MQDVQVGSEVQTQGNGINQQAGSAGSDLPQQDQRQGTATQPGSTSIEQGSQPARTLSQTESSRRGELLRREDRWPARRDLYSNHPFAVLQRMSDEMDEMFSQFGFGRLGRFGPQGRGAGGSMWSPQVELFERDNQLVVHADLPGLKKEDVHVQVDDDLLIIRGERRQERKEDEAGFFRSERSYGAFERRFALPEGTDADQVKANFRDGVLEVTLPKPQRPESRARTVDVD